MAMYELGQQFTYPLSHGHVTITIEGIAKTVDEDGNQWYFIREEGLEGVQYDLVNDAFFDALGEDKPMQEAAQSFINYLREQLMFTNDLFLTGGVEKKKRTHQFKVIEGGKESTPKRARVVLRDDE